MSLEITKPSFDSDSMRAFQKLGTKVLSVSREEIERREAAHKAKRKNKKTTSASSRVPAASSR